MSYTYKEFRKTIEEMASDYDKTPENMNNLDIAFKKFVYDKDLNYVGEQWYDEVGLLMEGDKIIFTIIENGEIE